MAVMKLVKSIRLPGEKQWSLRAKTGGISQSLLGSYQCCPRRFLLQLNRWYEPSKERNMAYGSMVHQVLDNLYTLFFKKKVGISDLADVVMRGISIYELPSVLKGEEQEHAKAIGEAVLLEYVRYYAKDFKELRFEAIEETFCVPFGPWWLRGKKDGRFRDKMGGIWHIEHKNYSRINEETITMKLSFDLQNLFYLLADYIEFKRQLKGVLYNILRRPDVRKEMLMGNLREYVQKAIRAKPEYYFLRWEIPYTADDLNQFKNELEHKLNRLDVELHGARNAPEETLLLFWKNECACDQPYSCEFLQACSGGHMTGFKQKSAVFSELA